jgi:hypothetical protein
MVVGKESCAEKNIQKNLNKIKKFKGEMAEWFKAVDCKSIEFSHRRFKSYFLLFNLHVIIRNMAQSVARLFWEQEVMCSNHIISKLLFLLINS